MTKALGLQDTTELHQKFNDARDWVQLEGADNWLFGGVFGGISDALNAIVLFFQELIAIPAFPRPVPEIGWLGCRRPAGWFTYAFAGLRSTILVTATLLFFGVVDLWSDSMDTLIITLLAVVICMVVGIPLGIWMARSKAVSNSVTPVLDIMQTFPPFCYLAPLALFFGIGSACALVLTIIYALPPDRADHRARHPLGLPDHAGGGPVAGTDRWPDAPVGAAADGPPHHRRRHQPVHDGRAVDGHHRRPGQRTRARQARGLGAPDAERGCGLRRRPGHRLHGDHARPHHDRRQRARHRPDQRRLGERHGRDADDASCSSGCRGGPPRTPAAASACRASPRRAAGCCWRCCSSRSLVCVYLSRQQLQPRGVPRRQRDAGAEVDQRARADPPDQRVHRLVRRQRRHLHDLDQGPGHRLPDQPAAGPAVAVPVVVDGHRAAGRGLRAGRLAAGGDHGGVRGGHPLDGTLERHDGHACR